VAYRHEVLTSCSRKLALICGLLLLAVGQAWSTGAPSAPQIKQASVNGVTLVYEEQGDGAPVVFIHGCCTDYRAWDAQRQAIAPHYRFIGLNLRYHGTAPWPDDGSKYSHQTHADDIAAFIRGLNAGPVDLVGWSYSGLIVMLVAVQHPELVHSLTIHEPGSVSFLTDPASIKIAGEDRQAMLAPAIAAAKAGDAAGAARLVPIGVNHQPDFWDTATPGTRSMFADNARTIPLVFFTAPPPPPMTCDKLRQIKIPALMTYGGDTRPFYRIAAEGAASCIPGAQLVSIQGGRHLAIVQQPDAFNAALLQFLAKAGSQPKP
jgi:pimeloyl-ACP methyl ester carboxylesterase